MKTNEATKIGYARVSTQDQNLQTQLDILEEQGCLKIFQEKISGKSKDRPELQKMLDQLRPGDLVVIWKLDRLGRSLKDLITLVNEIEDKGAGLYSIKDNIDTSTSSGKLIFHIFASLAEFEREVISERTKAGLASARARGRLGGRPKGLSEAAKDKALLAESLYKQGELGVREIAKRLDISVSTFYRYLEFRGVKVGAR